MRIGQQISLIIVMYAFVCQQTMSKKGNDTMNMPIAVFSLLRSVCVRLSMPISTHFNFAMWSTQLDIVQSTHELRTSKEHCDKSPIPPHKLQRSENQQHKLAVNRSWMASEHHICRVWHSPAETVVICCCCCWFSLSLSLCYKMLTSFYDGTTTKEHNNTPTCCGVPHIAIWKKKKA